jgi:hypothetical protein
MHTEMMERRMICIGTIEPSLPDPLPETPITTVVCTTKRRQPTHTRHSKLSFSRFFCETGILRSARTLRPHRLQGACHKNQPKPEHAVKAHAMITKAQILALSPISFTFMPNIDEAVLIGMKMNARTVTVASPSLAKGSCVMREPD